MSEGFLILGPAAVVLFFSPSQETNGIGRAEVRGEGKKHLPSARVIVFEPCWRILLSLPFHFLFSVVCPPACFV